MLTASEEDPLTDSDDARRRRKERKAQLDRNFQRYVDEGFYSKETKKISETVEASKEELQEALRQLRRSKSPTGKQIAAAIHNFWMFSRWQSILHSRIVEEKLRQQLGKSLSDALLQAVLDDALRSALQPPDQANPGHDGEVEDEDP
ncbi:MAG: hypothetical protein ACYCW6_00145 [Candidatus Xenobia bacterium]